MTTLLSPEKSSQLATIATELGLDPEMARLLPIQVTVETLDDSYTEAVLAHMAEEGVEEAAAPITETGLPRMLKLTAWIAHAGPANRNGDSFLAEDLQEVVANGLFQPPHLGMVDFNHDFFPYGAWYSAKFEFDPKAGEFGILAEGTIFAWRFSEIADKILAEQSRNGSVAVSMACIAQGLEFKPGRDGLDETVLRKPVFLAVSVLDVPPADPNARAVGTESDESTPEERLRDLNKALLSIHATDGVAFSTWAMSQAKTEKASQTFTEEETMDVDKIIEQVTEALGEQASEFVQDLKEAVAEAARVPSLEATVTALEEQITALQADVIAANEQIEEKNTEIDALTAALEAKAVELTEASEVLDTVQTERDVFVTERDDAILAAVREERLEMLPQTFITILDKREEESREKVIARLVGMSDEEFEAELELVSAGSSTVSYKSRSDAEGGLTSSSGSPAGGLAIDKFFN